MRLTPKDIRRFWASVKKTDTCWLWIAGRSGGYGTIYIDGRSRKAHRVSYLLHHGSIEDWVLHSCDNRACVRPDHLFPGDHNDNMQDMVTKGRASRLLGENNGNARLTEGQVAVIKAGLRDSDLSQEELAEYVGCSQQTISNIALGRSWEWVEPADDW